MPVTVRCALAKNAPLSSFPRRRKPSSRKLDPPPAGGDSKGGSFITFGGPQAHGVLGVTVQSHFFHSLFCPVCLSRTAGLQPGRCRPKGRRCLARRRGSWRRGNPSMTDRLSPRRLGQAASSRPPRRSSPAVTGRLRTMLLTALAAQPYDIIPAGLLRVQPPLAVSKQVKV